MWRKNNNNNAVGFGGFVVLLYPVRSLLIYLLSWVVRDWLYWFVCFICDHMIFISLQWNMYWCWARQDDFDPTSTSVLLRSYIYIPGIIYIWVPVIAYLVPGTYVQQQCVQTGYSWTCVQNLCGRAMFIENSSRIQLYPLGEGGK